jgi:hypothetical protein
VQINDDITTVGGQGKFACHARGLVQFIGAR